MIRSVFRTALWRGAAGEGGGAADIDTTASWERRDASVNLESAPQAAYVARMPELPEVERAARRLAAAATGRTIVRLVVTHPALGRHLTPRQRRTLAGRRIVAVDRRGKHQRIGLDDGRSLDVHFRMNGDWDIGRTADPEPRFARATIDLDDGTRIALVDSRALSVVVLRARGDDSLDTLGPEPGDASFTAATLGAALARKRGPIKPALLDQRVVAGLGNIYAAESLWHAGISPRAPAARLSAARRARLVTAIRLVLELRPAARYTDDVGPSRWNVYDREGQPCRRCAGTIRRIVQAARSTYYCPRCQHRAPLCSSALLIRLSAKYRTMRT